MCFPSSLSVVVDFSCAFLPRMFSALYHEMGFGCRLGFVFLTLSAVRIFDVILTRGKGCFTYCSRFSVFRTGLGLGIWGWLAWGAEAFWCSKVWSPCCTVPTGC
ncbi:hypothetical protein QBC34DRAFT_407134, partial [Podospora aff. communis PSN243]